MTKNGWYKEGKYWKLYVESLNYGEIEELETSHGESLYSWAATDSERNLWTRSSGHTYGAETSLKEAMKLTEENVVYILECIQVKIKEKVDFNELKESKPKIQKIDTPDGVIIKLPSKS